VPRATRASNMHIILLTRTDFNFLTRRVRPYNTLAFARVSRA
jgi:hypothetical protein